MRKALVTAGIVTAVSAASLTGIGIANAATSTSTSSDPMSSLVDAIASKFNLNKSDVQSVFDEQRTQMEAQREQKAKDQVAQLVTDGKLTQAQADAINTKRAELEKEREANRSTDQTKTQAERKAEMESRRTTLDTWLKDNGISTDYAYLLMGGRGHGPGGPGGPRDANSNSTQPSSTSTSTTQN